MIGAPISGLLLGLDGMMGLKGWQWLFIIEGIPSVLLGIVTWFYLTDRPEKADWLTAEQKAWLAAKLQAEIATKQAAKHLTLGQALSSPKVIMLSLVYFGFVGALYGMQFWLPQIVKAFGLTNAQTGFVTAIPFLFGTIAMILWARHSDATRERVAHVGGPLLLTAVGARRLQLHRRSRHDDGAADDRGDRRVLYVRGVLDAADGVAVGHRRRRRDRADQFDRQPRGLRRAVSGRLGQGCDREHVDRPAGAVAAAARGGASGVPRRARHQDRIRRRKVSRSRMERSAPGSSLGASGRIRCAPSGLRSSAACRRSTISKTTPCTDRPRLAALSNPGVTHELVFTDEY